VPAEPLTPLAILTLASSALFAWSMGSHYIGAVMGTAYGSGVLTQRVAQLVAAGAVIVGGTVAGIGVIDTYAGGLLPRATAVDVTAAQLAAALVTTASTYFKLPTSTIQIFTFSLLGAALVGRLPLSGAGFGYTILFWAIGPLLACAIGFVLAKFGLDLAERSQKVLVWFVIVVSVYSSFTLGSNDVSNAAASLVALGLMPARAAGLFGGVFMALGILTWGRGLLQRIGRDILKLDVPLAATAQVAQALTMTIINTLGHNASINQTIVGGLSGSGFAVDRRRLNMRVIRNILVNWTLSPALGLAVSALITVGLRAMAAS
jgi:PiT family inorganic phosphate transporter